MGVHGGIKAREITGDLSGLFIDSTEDVTLKAWKSRFGLALAGAGQSMMMTNSFATITLGVSDWPGWVAWYVAEHNGYLKKYHADVKLVWFSSYTTSVEALSAGKLDANCQALIDTLAPIEKAYLSK